MAERARQPQRQPLVKMARRRRHDERAVDELIAVAVTGQVLLRKVMDRPLGTVMTVVAGTMSVTEESLPAVGDGGRGAYGESCVLGKSSSRGGGLSALLRSCGEAAARQAPIVLKPWAAAAVDRRASKQANSSHSGWARRAASAVESWTAS